MENREIELYDIFNQLQINYHRYEHKAVNTIIEAKEISRNIPGLQCKNLFLYSKKQNEYLLVIIEENKRIDLNELSERLDMKRLSFASNERMNEILNLTEGVTPFSLIYDKKHIVEVVIDEELVSNELINFHPNVTNATVGILYNDLIKFINWCENKIKIIKL